ncbi:MAG: hypothetical protein SXA11_24040 [Cyanobacteriota bacterium]|nr:hypothetical protein [Cyanobacteriota bacterium]
MTKSPELEFLMAVITNWGDRQTEIQLFSYSIKLISVGRKGEKLQSNRRRLSRKKSDRQTEIQLFSYSIKLISVGRKKRNRWSHPVRE